MGFKHDSFISSHIKFDTDLLNVAQWVEVCNLESILHCSNTSQMEPELAVRLLKTFLQRVSMVGFGLKNPKHRFLPYFFFIIARVLLEIVDIILAKDKPTGYFFPTGHSRPIFPL